MEDFINDEVVEEMPRRLRMRIDDSLSAAGAITALERLIAAGT